MHPSFISATLGRKESGIKALKSFTRVCNKLSLSTNNSNFINLKCQCDCNCSRQSPTPSGWWTRDDTALYRSQLPLILAIKGS